MRNDMVLVELSCDTVALLLAVRRDQENGVGAVIDRLALLKFPPVLDEHEPCPRHESEPISRRPRGK